MDKTETYIRQCDCPEIQELKPSIKRKFPYAVALHEIFYEGNNVWFVDTTGFEGHVFWLPQQDDLQKMVGQLPTETYLVRKLYEETYEYSEHYKDMVYKPYYLQFTSMEQLWLAFVMKEKHNKIWSGTEWRNNG